MQCVKRRTDSNAALQDASQPKPYVPRAVKERRADRETANGLPRTGTHEERSAPIYNLTYKVSLTFLSLCTKPYQPRPSPLQTVSPETKVLCCIISVKPLALIVSLPGQLVGHVPVTQISSSYTRRLDTTDSLPDVDMNQDEDSGLPELSDMFSEGMWLRAVVTKAQPLGVKTMVDLGAVPLTDDERSCGRVELSIAPENVNVGVTKDDLTTGFVSFLSGCHSHPHFHSGAGTDDGTVSTQTLPAAVRSVEDHGYILDFGIAGITGFLSFDEAHKGARGASKLPVGMVIQCSVTSLSANGRTCSVSVDPTVLRKASVSSHCAAVHCIYDHDLKMYMLSVQRRRRHPRYHLSSQEHSSPRSSRTSRTQGSTSKSSACSKGRSTSSTSLAARRRRYRRTPSVDG